MSELAAMLLPAILSPEAALLLVLASFFTSGFTAAFGLGGGVAMLALLGLFLPVAALIPVHGAVQLGSNAGRAWHQRASIRWPIVIPFVAGSLPGAIAGGLLVVELPDAALKLVLGIFILAVTWAQIPGFNRLGRVGLALGGVVISLLGMFFGATGPMAAAFLGQAIANDRLSLVASHAAAMVAQHGLKVLVFGALGFAFWQWLPLVLAMILAGYAGTVTGTRLLGALSEQHFRFWFRITLTLLALDLMRRGLAAM